MSEKELNYEEDLSIDHNALDVEFLLQPQLFMKYSEMAADARLEVDRAKELLDVVRAECDQEIRENANREASKVTEAFINNQIVLHPRYREAAENLNILRHKLEILLSAVKAFDQRKSSLENLVKLYQGSYFAGPLVPHDLNSDEFRERIERKGKDLVQHRIRKRMNKK